MAEAAGEPVVELETEKVNVEVVAEMAGTLEKIARPEGKTVHPGQVLGVIAEGVVSAARPSEGALAAAATEARPAATPVFRPTSPAARQTAAERGIELARVPGTGRGGRVTVEDVLRYAEQVSPAPAGAMARAGAEAEAGQPTAVEVAEATPVVERPPTEVTLERPVAPEARPEAKAAPVARREERVRLSRRRLTIVRRLMEAQPTTASLTTFNEIDMSAVQEVRRRRGEAFRERHGVKLGFTSFFTKAAVAALKAFPQLNAEMQGDELVLKHYTFTITNGGVFGSLLSTPMLNAPQVGILGMRKIETGRSPSAAKWSTAR